MNSIGPVFGKWPHSAGPTQRPRGPGWPTLVGAAVRAQRMVDERRRGSRWSIGGEGGAAGQGEGVAAHRSGVTRGEAEDELWAAAFYQGVDSGPGGFLRHHGGGGSMRGGRNHREMGRG
jgi:hypothetical protein